MFNFFKHWRLRAKRKAQERRVRQLLETLAAFDAAVLTRMFRDIRDPKVKASLRQLFDWHQFTTNVGDSQWSRSIADFIILFDSRQPGKVGDTPVESYIADLLLGEGACPCLLIDYQNENTAQIQES